MCIARQSCVFIHYVSMHTVVINDCQFYVEWLRFAFEHVLLLPFSILAALSPRTLRHHCFPPSRGLCSVVHMKIGSVGYER